MCSTEWPLASDHRTWRHASLQDTQARVYSFNWFKSRIDFILFCFPCSSFFQAAVDGWHAIWIVDALVRVKLIYFNRSYSLSTASDQLINLSRLVSRVLFHVCCYKCFISLLPRDAFSHFTFRYATLHFLDTLLNRSSKLPPVFCLFGRTFK